MAVSTIVASAVTEKATNNWKPIMLTLGTVALLYYGPKYSRNVRAKNFANNNIGNPNAIAAAILDGSFTRLGYREGFLSVLMPEWDIAADEDAIYQVADSVTDVQAVAEAYNILTRGRVLLDDLKSGLATDEMKSFFNRIQSIGYNNSEEVFLIGAELYNAKKSRITLPQIEKNSKGEWVTTGELYGDFEPNDFVGEVFGSGVDSEGKTYYNIQWCTFFQWQWTYCGLKGRVYHDQVTNIKK
ncbi:hypothetical protein EZY14_009130 [Kordia sp. TARA_039_SRF]|nr:hypothetical protein EZY14_009130 [Kordia sp. TARA_039_SRF]